LSAVVLAVQDVDIPSFVALGVVVVEELFCIIGNTTGKSGLMVVVVIGFIRNGGGAELNMTPSAVTPSVGFFEVFILVTIDTWSSVDDSNPVMIAFDIVTGGKVVFVGIGVVDDGVPDVL